LGRRLELAQGSKY